jgi:endonuclease/exonuclease/phosphatase family metal-dependent hydrolase
VRLATFNVLHGRPMHDGHPGDASDGRPLADAIAALDADVLALQEVDRHLDRSGRSDQALAAASAMGAADWRFASAGPGLTVYSAREAGQGGPSAGIALLTRLPVRDWRALRMAPARLPTPVKEAGRPALRLFFDHPRVALAAVLEGPSGPFTVAASHLSLMPPWNGAQLLTLRRWIAPLPRPHLLLGDLNMPGLVPATLLGPRWRDLARGLTFPAHRPILQIDHVLANGLGLEAVRHAEVPVIPVSDHRPLVVEVEL